MSESVFTTYPPITWVACQSIWKFSNLYSLYHIIILVNNRDGYDPRLSHTYTQYLYSTSPQTEILQPSIVYIVSTYTQFQYSDVPFAISCIGDTVDSLLKNVVTILISSIHFHILLVH